MREKYIQGIYGEIAGKLEQKIMDLENLLSNPVGIGEHSSISEEIKLRIEEVDKLTSLKSTMESLFTQSAENIPATAPEQNDK